MLQSSLVAKIIITLVNFTECFLQFICMYTSSAKISRNFISFFRGRCKITWYLHYKIRMRSKIMKCEILL